MKKTKQQKVSAKTKKMKETEQQKVSTKSKKIIKPKIKGLQAIPTGPYLQNHHPRKNFKIKNNSLKTINRKSRVEEVNLLYTFICGSNIG